jgi:hypothetical protein
MSTEEIKQIECLGNSNQQDNFFCFSHKLLCQFLQTLFCFNQIFTAYQDAYELQVFGFGLKSVNCWYYK